MGASAQGTNDQKDEWDHSGLFIRRDPINQSILLNLYRGARNASVIEAHIQPDSPRLIGEIADASAKATLAIEREERPCVRDIVHVQRGLPICARDAGAHVHQTVARKLGVEGEYVLRQRSADRVRRK